MKDLTTGKPIKIILLFAIPLFIGQLFQLFYSLADTRIVGAILGETSLAAVGATTTLSDFLIGLLNGFTNGCAIIIATYFGSGDRDNMKKAIGGTILSGIVLSVLISAGCLLFLPRILGALNVADFLMAESKAYIGIVLAGLLAATLCMYEVIKAGGFTNGGLNFDAKARRGSFELEDIFHSYIAGMDTFALGYKIALKLIEDGRIDKFVEDRYASWKTGIGADIISGKATMADLEKYALEKGEVTDSLTSGRQELLENTMNQIMFTINA